MKKIMFFATAIAAMALASCSEDALVGENVNSANDGAINFGVYAAGQSRALNTSKDDVQTTGFGVFAFSTETQKVADYLKTDYVPNFMYNQKVTNPTKTDGAWTYSPIKYWPNNPGALVSFFAYAPYIPELTDDEYTQTPDNNNFLNNVPYVAPYNVRLQLGKDYSGPGIEYVVPADPTKGIDLLWGQEKDQTYAPVNKPKANVEDKINFNFKHALSRLHFNVQVWVDTLSGNHGDAFPARDTIADGTTIKIEKVELVGKIAKGGTVRLYDGSWNIESGNYDNLVFEDTMLNKKVEAIVLKDAQKEIDLLKGTSMVDGKQLEDDEIDNFVMLIPGSQFFIRITYTVTTVDPENPKNNSVVTNVINSTDKNVKIGALGDLEAAMGQDGYVTLKAGQAYDFHLNIGMTSVKFDATVEDWKLSGNEIDLPANTTGEVTPTPTPEPEP